MAFKAKLLKGFMKLRMLPQTPKKKTFHQWRCYQLQLDDITITVVQKPIKHMYVRVYPPEGEVKISASLDHDYQTIRRFADARLDWIKKQQVKLQQIGACSRPKLANHERHYFLGQSYLLNIIEGNARPGVLINNDKIELYVRPQHSQQKRQHILDQWYRTRLKEIIAPLVTYWQKRMGVQLSEWRIKKMTSRWGSCNPVAGRIWLNLDLAKRALSCVEYVVVHELVHLFEPSHNHRFKRFMDYYLPQWRVTRDKMNQL